MQRRLAWVVVALAASACSPTLNWREARVDAGRVHAMFPCRPVSHAREVSLTGTPVQMTLHACRAGDAVYAVGVADVGEPVRVTPALRELGEAAGRNLGAEAAASQPLAVGGMTPNPQARRLQIDGRGPDGASLREEVALFARGTTVYQATVLGKALDPAAVQIFVEGLKVMP